MTISDIISLATAVAIITTLIFDRLDKRKDKSIKIKSSTNKYTRFRSKRVFVLAFIMPPMIFIIAVFLWIYFPKTITFVDIFSISFSLLYGLGTPIVYFIIRLFMELNDKVDSLNKYIKVHEELDNKYLEIMKLNGDSIYKLQNDLSELKQSLKK